MLGLLAQFAISHAFQSGRVLPQASGGARVVQPSYGAPPPRAFSADEFNFLEKRVREEILDVVTIASPAYALNQHTQFFVVRPSETLRYALFNNKKLIIDHFLVQLLEKFIGENRPLDPQLIAEYSSALSADSNPLSESVFRISPIVGSPDVFIVRVPFGAVKCSNSPKLTKAAKSKLQLIGDGTQGASSVLVSKKTLEEIFMVLKALVDLQKVERSISDFVPRVSYQKNSLCVDEHPYADIYEGKRGIAYRGQGLSGLLYSLPASLFEAKPKNNLEKVIRLFRNYQNQLKSATHTHTTEVAILITELEKLAPLYTPTARPEEVDLLIIGLLQRQFGAWSEARQTGSAMRRVVFAIYQIIPASVRDALTEGSVASSAAGAASISDGPR